MIIGTGCKSTPIVVDESEPFDEHAFWDVSHGRIPAGPGRDNGVSLSVHVLSVCMYNHGNNTPFPMPGR